MYVCGAQCVVNECKSHFTSFADPSTEDLGQHCHWVRPTNTVCAGPKCASSNPSPPHPCKAQHAKGTLCCVHCVHTYTCMSQVCVCVCIILHLLTTGGSMDSVQHHRRAAPSDSGQFLLFVTFTTHDTYVCTSNERYQFCTGNH